jgi:hypothetical protein
LPRRAGLCDNWMRPCAIRPPDSSRRPESQSRREAGQNSARHHPDYGAAHSTNPDERIPHRITEAFAQHPNQDEFV